ncbi:MAG: hypothetical protein Q8Q88_18710 [Phenylobacterium sp.]|nr:hypothetical protein [Phenylobacterium sp.]MDP3749074.1 hypothetical protein [Phenylobacterium sp.]
MTWIFQFLTSLRTSPHRAVMLEVGLIVLGGLLLGVAFFRMGH